MESEKKKTRVRKNNQKKKKRNKVKELERPKKNPKEPVLAPLLLSLGQRVWYYLNSDSVFATMAGSFEYEHVTSGFGITSIYCSFDVFVSFCEEDTPQALPDISLPLLTVKRFVRVEGKRVDPSY